VAGYLGVGGDSQDVDAASKLLLRLLGGSERKESRGVVFSRFLNYLRYCERQVRPGTVLEMGWFVS
jgi:hypothetical protein